MRTAVIVVSLIAAAVAEAPYHLPRPAASAPSFNYQSGGSARPQANFASSGYNYQQPSIQPAYIPPQVQYQQSAPQPQYQQPQFRPQPAPQPNFNSGYNYQQPSIQPAFVPQQFYQPAPQSIPSTSYGVPQAQAARPLPPVYIPPVSAPVQVSQPANYQQQYSQQGYYVQSAPAPQFSSQSYSNGGGISSYQSDSQQYSGSQGGFGEALDSVVVNKLQSILRESEHSSARNSGYQSLVSGVSLESVRPSVELSSFVSTGPVARGGTSFGSQGSGSAESIAVSAPAPSYGLPSVSVNSQSSSSGSFALASAPQPSSAYGPAN